MKIISRFSHVYYYYLHNNFQTMYLPVCYYVTMFRERRKEKEREDMWKRLDKLNVKPQPVAVTPSPSRTRRRKQVSSTNSSEHSTLHSGSSL